MCHSIIQHGPTDCLPLSGEPQTSATYPAVHVIPAEKLGAAWHNLKSEALPSIHAVVPLAVAAARHVTGGFGCGDDDGAGGGCERHRR